ncbi:hypothetical protein R1flu_028053 [Riccia fluitans]|uniref:Uncharacterized protein n=1 Tax=Riccia fluitans TaxID=41844 RepID=A0ABD1XKN7_9MARC
MANLQYPADGQVQSASQSWTSSGRLKALRETYCFRLPLRKSRPPGPGRMPSLAEQYYRPPVEEAKREYRSGTKSSIKLRMSSAKLEKLAQTRAGRKNSPGH